MSTHRKCDAIESDAQRLVEASLFEGLDFDSVVKVLRACWVSELRDRAETLAERDLGGAA